MAGQSSTLNAWLKKYTPAQEAAAGGATSSFGAGGGSVVRKSTGTLQNWVEKYTPVAGQTPAAVDVKGAKSALEAARQKEQSALNEANRYVNDNMGALDMRDPAELEALNKAATEATEERKRLESYYYSLPGAYENEYGGMSDAEKAVGSVISKPFLAVDALVETARNAAQGKEMDMNSLAMQRYTQIGKLREDALSETSGVGRLLAETGLSIADNLYSRLLSVGTSGGALLSMGVSSAADKAHELGKQGESAERALVRGAVSGGIEAATEKLPLDTLAGLVKTGGKGVIKNLLKQGGVETSEEGVSYFANWVADKLAKDPNATWSWDEFAQIVASGGLSGLFFGLGGTAVNWVNSGTLPFDAKLAEENTKAKILPVESPAAAAQQIAEAVVEEVKTGASAVPVEGAETAETGRNQRLTENDLQEYLTVGDRQHVRNLKAEQVRSGGSPILTTLGEVKNFIKNSIAGDVRNIIKGYGRVGTKMGADIAAVAKQKGVEIAEATGYYLELDANHLSHLSDHIRDDGDPRNIPLTDEQAMNLAEYIDTYDDILDVIKKSDGSVRVLLGKKINGHAVIVEMLSKGRKSLHPVTAWQNKTEHYLKKYGKNKTQVNTSQQSTEVESESGYKPTSSGTTVSHETPGVKNQYTQDGARVFTPQAGWTSGELPLDESRRVNFRFLPGSGLDGAVTAWDGLLPFDAKIAQGQKNSASTGETESTAVNTDPAQHTAAEQAIIEEYQSETDEALKGTFESYFNDPKQGFSRHNISTVSERQASDAAKLLGGEYKGYKNAINSNGIQHILNEHGPNGSVDNSLSDLNDIARMGYVLDNYDAVEVVTYESGEADLSREFRTQDNRPAPMLKFSKKVNGTYYVVEAIPESKHKKFWVVSAYMQKADSGTQALDANGPETTPKASLASSLSTSDTNVPQAAPGVNHQYTQEGTRVFTPQAGRTSGELPLDENRRVNSLFLPGSGLDGAVTAWDGLLPFDAKIAQENIRANTLPVEAPAAVAGQKNNASTGETEQIVSESNMQRFRTVIDGVFTGANPSGSDIVVGDTPSILQKHGAPNLKLRITQNTVRKIVYPEGYMGGKHNLGMSAMKQLPYQIADPVAILKSKSQTNSLVLLTEWKTQDGQDVIVPIHLNKQGAVEAGNAIASAYGKGNINALLGENNENVVYTKNNEDIHQLLSNGLQLPEAMADDVLAKNTIPQNEESVKKQDTQDGAQVFTPQAGRTRFELPPDESRRVNFGFLPGGGLDGAVTAWDGLLPFDAKIAQENIRANTLPVEDPAAVQAGAKYRAEKPQNVEYPTVPIIKLSMQDVADLNGGTLPRSGNSLRTAAIDRTRTGLGLDQNSAVYIPASNVMRNGEEYVLKITRSSLNKMLSPSNGGVVAPESIAVLENIERIANSGVYFKSEGDRQGRSQIAGYDHLLTTVYIDNQPYVVDMRVRVYDAPSGGENRLYYFTPEEIVTTKKVGANFPTGTLHERTMSQKTAPTSNTNVPQAAPGVKKQYTQDGARVFTPQAGRTSGELPPDESRRVNSAFLPGSGLDGAPTAWDGLLPFDAGLAQGRKNAASTGETEKYTAEEANKIRYEGKTFRNIIAGIDSTVTDFFDKWRFGRKSHLGEKLVKLYLGKMNDAVKREVSGILGYEVSERDFIVTNDDVKHIMDEHGDAEAEIKKGNLPLEQWVFEAVPDVVTMPDTITEGHEGSGKNSGKIGLKFEKTLPNGKVVCVQFDNKGRGTMEVTTVYAKESTSSVVPAPSGADTRTPKVTESVVLSNTNVPQAAPGVKKQYTQDGARVFTPQAGRTSGELPLDENRRVNYAFLPGSGLDGAVTAWDGLLPFDAGLAQGRKNAASAGETAVNENGLVGYSEMEMSNLSSGKRNKIISTFSDAVNFVRNALSNKQTNEKAYFGKITDVVAQRVADETGIDVTGYNAILQGDNARHIVKQHGDVITENARGQSPVTAEDIALIPEVLSSPDVIKLSSDVDNRGRQVIIFEKQIGDNYVTMQAVSDGTHSLQTDTLYKQKKKNSQDTEYYNVSGNTDPAHNVRNVPSQSSSNTNVPRAVPGVKKQYTQDGARVFTPQAGRTSGELPLDENRRVNYAFLPGSGLDGAVTAWDGMLPFDDKLAQEQKNSASTGETARQTGNKGETASVIQKLKENIPKISRAKPVHSVSAKYVQVPDGRTMAQKAGDLFEKIKGIVTRNGLGEVEINTRSVKDDLSHGVGPAKAAVIPAIPSVIQNGEQIDYQKNWKGRPYDGYVFAAPVKMDNDTVYVAAVVLQTSKNRFYLHEVVDSNGNIIKISSEEGANQTSLATEGDAGAQSPLLSNTRVSHDTPGVNHQYTQEGTQVFTPQAGRTRFELPLDESRRVNYAFLPGSGLDGAVTAWDGLLPFDDKLAQGQKNSASALAETEDYYFDEAENNTSWRDRMYTENGKTYIQSQDRQRMYEVPGQDEIKYEVRGDGAVILGEDVLSNLSPRDYRDFAKAYAELNLVTKYAADRVTISEAKPVTVNSTGNNIIITQTGISEYAKKLRGKGIKNRDNVSSVLLLNKLIENASPISAAGNTHRETGNPFTYYKSKFEVGGRTYEVTLHIKNVPGEDHYYYHALDKVDIEAET